MTTLSPPRAGLRLLDLFCGAGGAARGYQEAGFYVVGVDNKPQPRYAGDEFIQADALEFLDEVIQHKKTWGGVEFDAIHASPPCQAYSIMRNLPWLRDREYPKLIDPTRERLEANGTPWVIENVMGAKLAAGWLCGGMFGLPFYRHRLFESNWFWMQPSHPKHEAVIVSGRGMGARARTVVVRDNGFKAGFDQPQTLVLAGHPSKTEVQRVGAAMGIDWMNRDELSEAIPPAYTRYIGTQLMQHLEPRL